MTALETESTGEYLDLLPIREQLDALQEELSTKESKEGKDVSESAEKNTWERFSSVWKEVNLMEKGYGRNKLAFDKEWLDETEWITFKSYNINNFQNVAWKKCKSIVINKYISNWEGIVKGSYRTTSLLYDESKGLFYKSHSKLGKGMKWEYITEDHAKKYLNKIEERVWKIKEVSEQLWNLDVDRYASTDVEDTDNLDWVSMA